MIIYLSKGGGLNPPRWMIIYLGGGRGVDAWMPCRDLPGSDVHPLHVCGSKAKVCACV